MKGDDKNQGLAAQVMTELNMTGVLEESFSER
jgi:hypothetical protein